MKKFNSRFFLFLSLLLPNLLFSQLQNEDQTGKKAHDSFESLYDTANVKCDSAKKTLEIKADKKIEKQNKKQAKKLYKSAIKDYKAAVVINPHSYGAYYALGLAPTKSLHR